jgi:hypothetical protein
MKKKKKISPLIVSFNPFEIAISINMILKIAFLKSLLFKIVKAYSKTC